jgi:NAD(P)-dependent dehydrogenase (short-subunit alcohol dehydrogenase family)
LTIKIKKKKQRNKKKDFIMILNPSEALPKNNSPDNPKNNSEKEKSCILITGASQGIGKSLAQHFSSLGYPLFLTGRQEEELQKLTQSLPHPSSYFLCDFSKPEALDALILHIQETLSFKGYQLKGIIHNAGIFKPQKSQDRKQELWVEQFQINLFSAVKLTEALIENLKTTPLSWILNIASSLATKPSAGVGAYGASKAAMVYWTQCLAIELGPLGIRANALCPGIIDTPIHSFHSLPPDKKNEHVEKLNRLQPLGRIGQTQDVTHAASFLAEDSSQWITGAVLNVDGGINLL